MITLALLLQAAAPQLDAIGTQELPASGCAAYLWSAADRRLVAMASADPARLRLMIDGRRVDLPRAEQRGEGSFGLAAATVYRAENLMASLDLSIATDGEIKDGAAVPTATLRVEAPGRDVLIVPLGGMVGCRS